MRQPEPYELNSDMGRYLWELCQRAVSRRVVCMVFVGEKTDAGKTGLMIHNTKCTSVSVLCVDNEGAHLNSLRNIQ